MSSNDTYDDESENNKSRIIRNRINTSICECDKKDNKSVNNTRSKIIKKRIAELEKELEKIYSEFTACEIQFKKEADNITYKNTQQLIRPDKTNNKFNTLMKQSLLMLINDNISQDLMIFKDL
jgi:hypothetical protein